MSILNISQVIPESNIIVLSPHYDDFVFFLGAYVLELKSSNLLESKKFENINVFSRSNYQARDDEGNKSISLERIKLATGRRLLEDLNCLDELLGDYNFKYRMLGEKESQVRGKVFEDSEMEFPHGMYEDFDDNDRAVFERVKKCVRELAVLEDTALVFPLGFKEHIDHFIVREAGIVTAKELPKKAKAKFYFAEDKPYSGIADEAEIGRIDEFIGNNSLECRAYRHHPEKLIELVFKHYISQVDEVYVKGINQRSDYLENLYSVNHPCDRIFVFNC